MRFTRTNNESVTDTTQDKRLIQLVAGPPSHGSGAASGNEAALNELMRRYKHKLFAFISKYVKDEDAAYDILQETFIRVHFKAESYSPAYEFSTWLHQIAINLCRDWGRKQKLRQFLSLDTSPGDNNSGTLHDVLPDTSGNIEDLSELRQQLRIIDQEIEKLPHKLKTALILFALEENSQERCAEILGVTPKTVETRVYRARKILAEKLAKNF
ncbi:MAG: RNA polymerase sigma factor [Rickettsiales bacterium]|nr:RNA polymerase sigma factor [Rickettsiales bacterium]